MKLIKLITIFLFFVLLLIIIDFLFLNTSLFSFEPKKVYSNINHQIYIMPYLGDIDGEVSEDWFFFYEKVIDFHEKNGIPVTFSFYPASLGDEEFNKIFLKMYESKYIELMQKSYTGNPIEMKMYELPFEGQREMIKKGRDVFEKNIKDIYSEKGKSIDYVKFPIAYNQIGGVINNDTRDALESLGFKMYFDMFVEDGFNPVESTETFDIIEYGASFTETGEAGKERKFKDFDEIFSEINNLNREDVTMMIFDGRKIIPIWAHQQDFEDFKKENKLNKNKWEIYTLTLKALKNDPNVIFMTPEELYNLKH